MDTSSQSIKSDSANETPNNNYSEEQQIKQAEAIDGTPFMAIKHEGLWYIQLGKYTILKTDNITDILDQLDEHKWTIMLSLASIVVQEEHNRKAVTS